MQMVRNYSAPAAWLLLVAIALGGGLVATHSHDEGLTSGKPCPVALGDGHASPDTTESVESSSRIEGALCLACTAGQRMGVLATPHPTSRARVKVAHGVRVADDLAISRCDARPPAPRGPPAV